MVYDCQYYRFHLRRCLKDHLHLLDRPWPAGVFCDPEQMILVSQTADQAAIAFTDVLEQHLLCTDVDLVLRKSPMEVASKGRWNACKIKEEHR